MKKLFRWGRYTILKNKNEQVMDNEKEEEIEDIPHSVDKVEEKLREVFSHASDLVIREILDKDGKRKVLLAYIDGIADKKMLNESILKPIMMNRENILSSISEGRDLLLQHIKYNVLYNCEIEDTKDFNGCIQKILSGDTFLYIDGQEVALQISSKEWEKRSIETPQTEAVVRGPREGFTESLRTNTSMLRRKIKNSRLKFEEIQLGRQTNTSVCICYIKGIADEGIIQTVRDRLQKIKIDAILESGYIEEFIEDHPYSIFPTVGNSEKPDAVAAKILEGRVAIFCDGTPFVLTVPHLFIETLQSSEDYYSRPFFSSVIRIIRFTALITTIVLPALYVALLSFHLGAIPFKLLLSMAASREGVPFSPFLEALLMIFAFEFLREAGVRMPRAVGQAVSIVGALILGEATVNAGVASDLLIIVISLTAITSFIVSSKTDAIIFIRIGLLIGAQILGLMGMILATFLFITHICSLQSFGVPYMAPIAPINTDDFKDTIIRAPMWAMIKRPSVLTTDENDKRQDRTKC